MIKNILLLLSLVWGVFSYSYESTEDVKYGLKFERDVVIEMRDGKKLYANVFSPLENGKYPVIVSMGPYGKDELPVKYDSDEGEIEVSKYAAFEVVDPAEWVPDGYVVINVDSRGSWQSEGDISVFSKTEAQDFYDIIEWAGTQKWSNGNIGTSGVSYFAISQWNVASLNPPHLKAIIPWEGLTDVYRDAVYHGGIEEKGFLRGWYSKVTKAKRKGSNPEKFIEGIQDNTLYNDFYKERTPDLSKIEVPAFIVSSWSDHGLHSRGTIEGYKNISSEDKWMYIHGKKKWEFFYSEEGVAEQKRFFDFYLKGIKNNMLSVPRVRYAVRDRYYEEEYLSSSDYPLSNVEHTKLYLDASSQTLNSLDNNPFAKVKVSKNTRFNYTFGEDTVLVAGMTLKTYISTSKHDDADLFVGIEKLDVKGKEVYFQGNDTEKGHVASGWLRVSQRKVDTQKSTDERIYLTHDEIQKIKPGEIIEVNIEILPSGTSFKKGETLSLVISNKDLKGAGDISHVNINKGNIWVHTGEDFPSYLQVPKLIEQN